jgi:hypothetical protein
MSKYLKLFRQHSDYQTFIGGGRESEFILPNVSHCIEENDVHYNPTELIIKYTVSDASVPTQLYYYDDYDGERGVDKFSKIEVDGTTLSIADLDTANGQYQLSAGDHIVKYTLKDSTYIPAYCFGGCDNITNVIIPDSIKAIYDNAFVYCTGITSITIPDNVNTLHMSFTNCTNLTDITIGRGMNTIRNAFDGCNLTNLTINSPTIKRGWFTGLQLENVTLGKNVQTIEDGAFCGCDYINEEDKENIEAINPNTFCETYCVIATFDDDIEKADFGPVKALGYSFKDSEVAIPNSEIITETRSVN